VPPRS